MTSNAPMPLEDESQQAPAIDDNVTAEESPQAKDVDGVPYCRIHHCRMTSASGGKKGSPTQYFKCPVPKCSEKGQRIKTQEESVVPPTPLCCPRCSKPAVGKKPAKEVHCERDQRLSTAAAVILKCPDCGWKSNTLPVPQLAASRFARSTTAIAEGVGDR